MTALVLENLAALPAYAKGLRMLPMRLARGIDALVSAGAARQVPEGQTREVQTEISRYRNIIRAAAGRPGDRIGGAGGCSGAARKQLSQHDLHSPRSSCNDFLTVHSGIVPCEVRAC
jgi:hypothetical protein